MRILFIHGGGDGAYVYDSDFVSRLDKALAVAVPIEYPHIAGLEQIVWSETESQLLALLRLLPNIIIAHSIGAAAVLKIFAGGATYGVSDLFLLAPPYKAADSHWGIDDFTFPRDFPARLPSHLHMTLYHSDDDAVIPVSDARDYDAKLTQLKLELLSGYGHQFTGSLDAIADDVRSAIKEVSSRVSRR